MLHCKAFTVKVEFVLKVMCLYILKQRMSVSKSDFRNSRHIISFLVKQTNFTVNQDLDNNANYLLQMSAQM